MWGLALVLCPLRGAKCVSAGLLSPGEGKLIGWTAGGGSWLGSSSTDSTAQFCFTSVSLGRGLRLALPSPLQLPSGVEEWTFTSASKSLISLQFGIFPSVLSVGFVGMGGGVG